MSVEKIIESLFEAKDFETAILNALKTGSELLKDPSKRKEEREKIYAILSMIMLCYHLPDLSSKTCVMMWIPIIAKMIENPEEFERLLKDE